ncbi:MAG: efflux RND transporter periplasmic adaptor subunit, partial [Lancefieldella rimae]|nr:efflux RND transporter periplasmic adaptor subunit [Lancefieldella rimae]
MFHFDRKLQQEKVDTSSGDNPSSDGSTPPDGNASPDNERHIVSAHKVPDISDKTADINSRIEVITSAEDEEDAEAREAYESLMRHRKIRLRKKFIKVGIALGVVVLIGIAFVARLFESDKQVEAPTASTAFITRGEFSDSVSASGSIKPISSTVVTPEVDGIIQ